MQTGTVQWFSNPQGRGMIRTEDGRNLFVHCADIEGGLCVLAEGDRVEFEECMTDEGPKAVQVKRVSP